jgi:hypothetical protein
MKTLETFPGKTRRAKKAWVTEAISPEKLNEGCFAFPQRKRRDAVYKTATFLVEHFWAKSTEAAEGLGDLLSDGPGATPSFATVHSITTQYPGRRDLGPVGAGLRRSSSEARRRAAAPAADGDGWSRGDSDQPMIAQHLGQRLDSPLARHV